MYEHMSVSTRFIVSMYVRVWPDVSICVCVNMCMHVCVCVCVCVCMCVSGCAYTFISCVAQAAIKEVSDCDLCFICIGILVAGSL